MSEYNKIMEGTFTSNGKAHFVSLPYMPSSFEMWNLTEWGVDTDDLVNQAWGFQNSAAGTAYVTINTGSNTNDNAVITSGGFSFISAGTYQYGPIFTVTGIVASTGVVTTSAAHGYAVGDTVVLYGTTGMLQIAGVPTTITAVPSTTTFTIGNFPTSLLGSNASAGFVKKLLYPDLYIPFGNTITAITTGVSTIIQTAVNHDFVVGQEVYFVIPNFNATYANVYGTYQLDSQYVRNQTGIPQQAYVTAVTSNTLTVNINSTGYGSFLWPTSAQAALGITFPQVLAIGDANTGYTGPVVPMPQTIPGAFAANTRQGVLVGLGNGTVIMHANADVIYWRAILPDGYLSS